MAFLRKKLLTEVGQRLCQEFNDQGNAAAQVDLDCKKERFYAETPLAAPK
jgi:hypothetical protein